jgi:hypothetical protein
MAEQWLDDPDHWCMVHAQNLAGLDHEGRRLALTALGLEARVCGTNHGRLYEIAMRVGGPEISGLQLDCDAGRGGAHVDGYTPRGCATPGEHRAGRP